MIIFENLLFVLNKHWLPIFVQFYLAEYQIGQNEIHQICECPLHNCRWVAVRTTEHHPNLWQ